MDLRSIIFLFAAAVIPPLILMRIIYKMDRMEREPRRVLWSLFFLGILSTATILLLEEAADAIINTFSWSRLPALFLEFFVLPGFIEEGIKYWVLYMRTWDDQCFDYKFDAVVYAVFVSLSFASVENVMYVMNTEFGFRTAVLRAIYSIPGHAAFGVIMGSKYGEAKALEKKDPRRSRRLRRIAWIQAAIVHGLYDFLLMGFPLAFCVYFPILLIRGYRRLRRCQQEDEPLFLSEYNKDMFDF